MPVSIWFHENGGHWSCAINCSCLPRKVFLPWPPCLLWGTSFLLMGLQGTCQSGCLIVYAPTHSPIDQPIRELFSTHLLLTLPPWLVQRWTRDHSKPIRAFLGTPQPELEWRINLPLKLRKMPQIKYLYIYVILISSSVQDRVGLLNYIYLKGKERFLFLPLTAILTVLIHIYQILDFWMERRWQL